MFKNEEMQEFQYLTSKQMREIVNAAQRVECEEYDRSRKEWTTMKNIYSDDHNFSLHKIYRVKTPKEDDTPIKNIPWDFITEKFCWCAMDSDGLIFFFEEKPSLRNTYWDYGEGYCGDCILKVDTTGVVWNTSLTKRPQ